MSNGIDISDYLDDDSSSSEIKDEEILFEVKKRLYSDLQSAATRLIEEYKLKEYMPIKNDWVVGKLEQLLGKLQPKEVKDAGTFEALTQSDSSVIEEVLFDMFSGGYMDKKYMETDEAKKIEGKIKSKETDNEDKFLTKFLYKRLPMLLKRIKEEDRHKIAKSAANLYTHVASRANLEIDSLKSLKYSYNSADELVEQEYDNVKAFPSSAEHRDWTNKTVDYFGVLMDDIVNMSNTFLSILDTEELDESEMGWFGKVKSKGEAKIGEYLIKKMEKSARNPKQPKNSEARKKEPYNLFVRSIPTDLSIIKPDIINHIRNYDEKLISARYG